MLASAMLSLAAQHRPRASKAAGFSVAAGTCRDFTFLSTIGLPIYRSINLWLTTEAAWPLFQPSCPIRSNRPAGDLPALLAEVAQEVNRRQTGEDANGHSGAIYLFISDLGRFRDLRRDESDMGFSLRNNEKRISPSLLLGDIFATVRQWVSTHWLGAIRSRRCSAVLIGKSCESLLCAFYCK